MIRELLPIAPRQGTLVSPPFIVPLAAGNCKICENPEKGHDDAEHTFKARGVAFTMKIGAADRTDPTKSAKLGLQRQFDLQWRPTECQVEYVGGVYTDNFGNQPPGFILDGRELAGQTIRLGLVIPVSMQIGVQLEMGFL